MYIFGSNKCMNVVHSVYNNIIKQLDDDLFLKNEATVKISCKLCVAACSKLHVT